MIVSTGITRGLGFVNSIVIARMLGPAGYGEFAVFQLTMILTWQFAQAFDSTYIRYAKACSDPNERRDYLRSTVLLKIGYLVLLAIAAVPLSSFLSNVVFNKQSLFIPLLAAIVSGAFLTFVMTAATTYQIQERFVVFAFVSSSFNITTFCILCFVYVGAISIDLEWLVYFFLMSTATLGVIGGLFIIKKSGNPFACDRAALKKSLFLSRWVLGVTIVFFLGQRVDTFYVTTIMSFEEVGVYFAATQIVMIISMFSGPLSSVFLPMASVAMKNGRSLREYIRESLFASGIVVIFIILLMVGSPTILYFVFGNEYVVVSGPLRILLLGSIFWTLYQPLSYLFYTLDAPQVRFLLELFKLVVAIVLLMLLTPEYGLLGAAISITISTVVNALLSCVILYRRIVSFNLA